METIDEAFGVEDTLYVYGVDMDRYGNSSSFDIFHQF